MTESTANPSAAEGFRILVVDRDPQFIREVTRLAGAQVGDVLGVATAQEALAAVRACAPDLVLLDARLEGPDGAQALARELRAAPACESLPLVFACADSSVQERVAAAQAGCSAFLEKPLTAEVFGDTLRPLLSMQAARRPHVLTVDDDVIGARIVGQMLRRAGLLVTHLSEPDRILEALEEARPDLVLLDIEMDRLSGLDVCRVLRTSSTWRDLPILLLTAHSELATRIAAFQAGADDYLLKPVVGEELVSRVLGRLERSRLLRERFDRDPVTGLLARRAFLAAVTARLSESERSGAPLAIALLDMDFFKMVNDTHGNAAGDRVLSAVGRLLSQRLRAEDLRGRWGGEEFAVALPGASPSFVEQLLDGVLRELAQLEFVGAGGEVFHSTFSAGVACYPDDGAKLEQLLNVADGRLHVARRAGPARIVSLESGPLSPSATTPDSDASSLSVLVVEPRRALRETLVEALEARGHTVATYDELGPAWVYWQRARPALVLVDEQVGDGDGIELCRRIRRARGGDRTLLLMIGSGDSADVEVALSAGSSDYVPRSVAPVTLRLHIIAAEQRAAELSARGLAEGWLADREERYSAVMAGASVGLWDYRVDTGEMTLSESCRALLGHADRDGAMSEQSWFGRVHPEDLPRLREEIDAHVAGKTPRCEIVHRVLSADRSYRSVLCSGLAVRRGDLPAHRIAGSLTDVTEQSMHDVLTGLPNKSILFDRVDQTVQRASPGGSYAVICVDVDRFRRVNASVGYAAGDELPIKVARRLATYVGAAGGAARLGSNTFAMLIENSAGASRDLSTMGDQLVTELAGPYRVGGRDLFVSVSVGTAIGRPAYQNGESAVRDAETAMHRAKARGGAQSLLFDGAKSSQTMTGLHVESALHVALRERQFVVHYQPVVSLASGAILGFEALVRWNRPGFGIVGPASFIEVAEQAGLIGAIAEHVLSESARPLLDWAKDEVEPPKLSVNLSARQLGDREVEQLEATIASNRIPPERLVLEITETALMNDPVRARGHLERLVDKGMRVALDDFGTGYSSLSYLNTFPIHTLKIDRSFVARLGDTPRDLGVVRAIVALASELGLDVTAEGIQTTHQLEILRGLACGNGQGYWFSKPVPADEALRLVKLRPWRGA